MSCQAMMPEQISQPSLPTDLLYVLETVCLSAALFCQYKMRCGARENALPNCMVSSKPQHQRLNLNGISFLDKLSLLCVDSENTQHLAINCHSIHPLSTTATFSSLLRQQKLCRVNLSKNSLKYSKHPLTFYIFLLSELLLFTLV